jgi:hypothetical protein
MRSGNTEAFTLLRAMRDFLGDNDMMAYLAIITLAELLQNKRPDIPWVDSTVGKKAKREETGKQGTLLKPGATMSQVFQNFRRPGLDPGPVLNFGAT